MYDTKCYDLAATFLEDNQSINTEANRKKLAQEIQDTIDNWIEEAIDD